VERELKNKSRFFFLSTIKYYINFIILLYKLPIKLRLIDIQEYAQKIQNVREQTDRELTEYLEYLNFTHPEYKEIL